MTVTKILAVFCLIMKTIYSVSQFDEGCSVNKPARCPREDPYNYSTAKTDDLPKQGKCIADYSECKIAQVCYKSEQTYQCPEGICADRFDNCPYKNMDCLYKE